METAARSKDATLLEGLSQVRILRWWLPDDWVGCDLGAWVSECVLLSESLMTTLPLSFTHTSPQELRGRPGLATLRKAIKKHMKRLQDEVRATGSDVGFVCVCVCV